MMLLPVGCWFRATSSVSGKDHFHSHVYLLGFCRFALLGGGRLIRVLQDPSMRFSKL